MKILWVSSGFLHPTTRGGQIRTLEMLRRMRQRHEIHYLGLHDGNPEALARSSEYCARAWPVPFVLAPRSSPRFWAQTAAAIFSKLPVMVARKRSKAAADLIHKLLAEERFDAAVSDFLTPVVNLPPNYPFVLFEHNVETVIWRRYAAESEKNPVRRLFFAQQAERMLRFERMACQTAAQVIAVSEADSAQLRELSGAANVSAVPTGVDAEYFARPADFAASDAQSDLLFTGSMDWLPNIDGISWFVREALPLIRRNLPRCSLTIAGRKPAASIRALAEADPLICVTGTVDDMRPYLWAAKSSIVPLRIGSGTRLKIYEAMAASLPVVSSTVGAEGLEVRSPENILIADNPEQFAAACLALLEDSSRRERQAETALRLVKERFSWEAVSKRFEDILRHSASSSDANSF